MASGIHGAGDGVKRIRVACRRRVDREAVGVRGTAGLHFARVVEVAAGGDTAVVGAALYTGMFTNGHGAVMESEAKGARAQENERHW